MKRTLAIKFFLGYLLYAVIAFLFIMYFSQNMTYRTTINKEAKVLYREASLIASDYAADYANSTISLETFQNNMSIIGEYIAAKIWLMDSTGNIIVDSSDKAVGQAAAEQNYVTVKDFDITSFGKQYYKVGNFYDQFNEDNLTVFYPVTINFKNRGYLLIHKPVSEITRDTNTYSNITVYSILVVLAFGLLLYLIYTLVIFRPIQKITKVARSYAKGDFSRKIDVHTNDEMGYLANTLNYMADELDRLEEDQRKFVSNVSHDFRSPLTSINGYINAILDGTIPYEMQEKYLNIILFETERLNKLTQSLLDLNQFGNHGIRLDRADFDINNMIRTTIRTFEGKCIEKKLTFDLVLTGRELFVNADMSKIQQVLYNLIDNATKFSNNNSTIKIETHIRHEKVFVSVKDHGIGIPSESIKKIWERFYKSDSSRGKDKKGTGLGLSIVKEIIQAHNENINVISTEGVGTEFIFSLSMAQKEKELPS